MPFYTNVNITTDSDYTLATSSAAAPTPAYAAVAYAGINSQ
jgi:hypothetical protein